MDLGDHNLWILARQYVVQELRGRVLGEGTVFSPPHVETLDLELLNVLAIDLHQIDGRILLLGVEQKPPEDVINVNLQELVALIDIAFELLANLHRVLVVIGVGIDHD